MSFHATGRKNGTLRSYSALIKARARTYLIRSTLPRYIVNRIACYANSERENHSLIKKSDGS